MEPWITLVLQAGLGAAIAIFLIKWTTDKYTSLDKFVREELLAVISHANEQAARTSEAIADLCRVLREKPCLYDIEQRDRKQRDKVQG